MLINVNNHKNAAACGEFCVMMLPLICSGGKPCVVKIVRKMSDYYDLAKIEVNVLEKLKELDPGSKWLVHCCYLF